MDLNNISSDINDIINNIKILNIKTKEFSEDNNILPEEETKFLEYLERESQLTSIVNTIEHDITQLSFFFDKLEKLKELFIITKNYYLSTCKSNDLTEKEIEEILKGASQFPEESEENEDVEITSLSQLFRESNLTEEIEDAINKKGTNFQQEIMG